ncbi:MAG: PD-(D/E)XK nuclease family protein [Chloroflexota bacterium]
MRSASASTRAPRRQAVAAKKPRYSVSALVTYDACPLQYFDRFVRRIPPPRSDALLRGLAVHSLITRHFGQAPLIPLPVEADVQALVDAFSRSRFHCRPLAVEKPFLLDMTLGHVYGRIDLVLPQGTDGLEIVDLKTGPARSRDDLKENLQLPLYSLAATRLFGRRPEDLQFTYFFLDGAVEVSFPGDAAMFDVLEHRVENMLRAIQEKRFEPAPGCNCQACRRGRTR